MTRPSTPPIAASSCDRRRFLELGAGAAAAALGGCFGLSGSDYPNYTDWVPPSDEGIVAGYVDLRVTRDSPRAERLLPLLLPSRDGGAATEFVPDVSGLDGVDDPLIGWPLEIGGALVAGAAIGIAAGGLGYLVDPEKPEQVVDELLVADGVAVGVGEIDTEEADENLREGVSDRLGEIPFESVDEYREFTLYEPTTDVFDGVTAVSESAVVVADTRDELRAAIDAWHGNSDRVVDEGEAFEWLVDEAGRGDFVAGWTGSVDPSEFTFGDTDDLIAADLLSGRDHVFGSVDFSLEENEIAADLAVRDDGLDEVARDRLESELGTASSDASFETGDGQITASGTYTDDVLDVEFTEPPETPVTTEPVQSGDPPSAVAEAVPDDAFEFSYDGERQVKVGITSDLAVDEVTMRAVESGHEGSTTTPQSGLYFYIYIEPEGDEVVVTATVDGETGVVAQREYP